MPLVLQKKQDGSLRILAGKSGYKFSQTAQNTNNLL
jgi:hypothetical protein